jgi:hypothetical protein
MIATWGTGKALPASVTKRDYSIHCIARTRRVRYLHNARLVGGHGLASHGTSLFRRMTFGPSRPLSAYLLLARFRPDTESGHFFDLLRRTDRPRPPRIVFGIGANPLQTSLIY